MLDPQTLLDIPNATSSPVLGDGDEPFTLQVSMFTGYAIVSEVNSGRHLCRVNLSPSRVKEGESRTNATFGLFSENSSPSANLQSSLESRLRQEMAGNGSLEYDLTWKHWDMPSGPPICALRASTRLISDNGSTGWLTPRARGDAGDSRGEKGVVRNLEDQAYMWGRPAPTVYAGTGGAKKELNPKGYNALPDVTETVKGWGTPVSSDYKNYQEKIDLTPTNGIMSRQVWEMRGILVDKTSGTIIVSPHAETLKGGSSTEGPRVLNPAFSRWLMGYSMEWDMCAIKASRSLKKKQTPRQKPEQPD